MEAFQHGDHVVLDAGEQELRRIADALEEAGGERERDVAAKIRRGLERGATRIAVTRERAEVAASALSRTNHGGVGEAIERVLERMGDTDS